MDDNIINTVIDYGYKLINEIKTITGEKGENLEFYPELKISGDINEANGSTKKLVGSIDLLVVDGKGNSYIFDFKTSPKPYEKYDTAKVRTFMYQLAVYNRLL